MPATLMTRAADMTDGTSPTVSVDLTDDLETVVRRPMKGCPDCTQLYSADSMFCPFDGTRLEGRSWVATTDPSVDPLLGATIDGRYRVRRVLGEGGTGTVYEVRHETLSRLFAMKVLRADVAKEPTLAARFTQEARATASLKHPHIVSITDFGHTPLGTPYFVMDRLQGQTLAHVCSDLGRLPPLRGVRIVRQVADALSAAHAAGIVHRDLKPENLFLVGHAEGHTDGPDDVRVVDFGAAKIAGAGRMTKTGIVFGTPHYMSPEQASGQPVDHRADIYALGVIMYELFSGHLPFEADTFMGVLTQHMFADPPPFAPEGSMKPVFAALEEVTFRAMAKRPELRFQSMQALAEEMDRAVVVAADGTVSLAAGWSPSPPRRPSDAPASRASADCSEMHTSVDVSVIPKAFWPRGALTLAGAGLALGFVGYLALVRQPVEASHPAGPIAAAPARPSAPPPPPDPPSVPAPTLVSTHLSTTPPFVEIWQDDRRVGTAPVDVSLRPGDAPAVYTLRATGYADKVVVINGDSGTTMDVALQKKVTAASAPSRPKAPTSRSMKSGELIDPFEAH